MQYSTVLALLSFFIAVFLAAPYPTGLCVLLYVLIILSVDSGGILSYLATYNRGLFCGHGNAEVEGINRVGDGEHRDREDEDDKEGCWSEEALARRW